MEQKKHATMGRRLSPKLHEGMPGLLMHWCPGCAALHPVKVAGAGSWSWNGDRIKPTFYPSVKHTMPWTTIDGKDEPIERICHYYVTGGAISYCEDSTHELGGKTIYLPDIPFD